MNSHDRSGPALPQGRWPAGRVARRGGRGGPRDRARRTGHHRPRAGAPARVPPAGRPGRSRSRRTDLRRRARSRSPRRSSRRSLADRHVRATFFMLGSMVAKAPSLAAEIAAAGHEIGVHGFDHRYLTVRGPRATRSDLTRATDLIADVTGTRPRLFRPPVRRADRPGPADRARTRADSGAVGLLGPGVDAGRLAAVGAADPARAACDGGVTVLLHDSGCTSPPGAWQAGLGRAPAAAGRMRAARAARRSARRARRARGQRPARLR